MKDALILAAKIAKDEAELKEFLKDFYQTCEFKSKAEMLRCKFNPGTSTGPQFGEWKEHQKFHQAMGKICKKEIKKYESDD